MSSPLPVQVFIFQTQQTTALATNVSQLFSYTGNSTPTPPVLISFTTSIVPIQGTSIDAAEFAAINDTLPTITSQYAIFIMDTSISSSSPTNIYNIISECILLNQSASDPWDITYLCKLMDNCSTYQTVSTNVLDTNAKIVRTFSPNGFQAVLLSPTGLTKLAALLATIPTYTKPISLSIADQIAAGGWISFAITPNLISFDPALAKAGSFDYVKSAECRDPLPLQTPVKDSNMSFFWFVMVFIIVVVIIYTLIKIAPHLESGPSHRIMVTPIKT